MAKLQLTSAVADELLSLVGKIAIQWSYLDFLVSELLCGLKGLDENSRDAVRGANLRGDNGKIKQATDLLNSIDDQVDRENLRKLLEQAYSLAEDRNLVQHGIVVYRNPKDHNDPLIFVFRGKHKGTGQAFTKDWLVGVLSEMSQLTTNLLACCEKQKCVDISPIEKL
jgi:hypothetical protein